MLTGIAYGYIWSLITGELAATSFCVVYSETYNIRWEVALLFLLLFIERNHWKHSTGRNLNYMGLNVIVFRHVPAKPGNFCPPNPGPNLCLWSPVLLPIKCGYSKYFNVSLSMNTESTSKSSQSQIIFTLWTLTFWNYARRLDLFDHYLIAILI